MNRKYRLLLAIAGLAAVCSASASQAASEDVCESGSGKARVAACTADIQSGRFENGALYYNRGKAYDAMGQHARAIADFDQTIALVPGDANAFSARCFARAQMGTQREEALADCNKALELKPGTTDPLETRGFLYYRTGNYAGAIADATAALAIDPKDVDALYIRGLAKKKSADAKGGNADIAAANAIDKKIAKTYAGYGVKP